MYANLQVKARNPVSKVEVTYHACKVEARTTGIVLHLDVCERASSLSRRVGWTIEVQADF
jgi:hypothetical protein